MTQVRKSVVQAATGEAACRVPSHRDERATWDYPPDAVVAQIGNREAAVGTDLQIAGTRELRGARWAAVAAQAGLSRASDRRDNAVASHAPHPVVVVVGDVEGTGRIDQGRTRMT